MGWSHSGTGEERTAGLCWAVCGAQPLVQAEFAQSIPTAGRERCLLRDGRFLTVLFLVYFIFLILLTPLPPVHEIC